MKKLSNKAYGTILTLIGGTFWGISGTIGQSLFLYKGASANWLVPIRLFFAGLIMLILLFKKEKENIISLLHNKNDLIQLMLFSLIGMTVSQYCYFSTIQYSNAGVATVLQYLGPTMIVIYVCISSKRKPTYNEIIALIASTIGIFLLSTHGDISSFKIPGIALIYGIMSALGLMFYTVQPINLLKKYNTTLIIALAMFIGGSVLSIIMKPWHNEVTFDLTTFIILLFIIIFGTIIAFNFYLNGVKLIGPAKASILACIEPISAIFLSSVFFNIKFEKMDFIAIFLIMSSVVIISLQKD